MTGQFTNEPPLHEFTVDLDLSKALRSLDPHDLHATALFFRAGNMHCSVVRSFALSTNHVRSCKRGWSPLHLTRQSSFL